MRRRQYLRYVSALGGSAVVATTAGCLASSSNEAANEFDYPTYTINGINVPLVPVADAGEWYDDTPDVVFVDARDAFAYDEVRIAGSVWSPAPEGQASGDPVDQFDTQTRFVTYCVCPHSLATLRGESLIEDGYIHTYALDEGLQGWIDADLPIEGKNIERREFDSDYHLDD